ncbi:MAG TPA: CehA/McbA family metallohydrolase [Planctomycetota bacterium]|nr:CehA/McbA family metallohydrolase [Planctomycetota bacterium]
MPSTTLSAQRLRAVLSAALAGLAAATAASAQLGTEAVSGPHGPPVETPPGWYSGDMHIHMQPCTSPVNMSMHEVYVELLARDLDIGAVQLWGSRWAPADYFLAHYVPMVTGLEDPASDAAHRLQFGIEVSGFPASQFGHIQLIDTSQGAFQMEALYPGKILDRYLDALTGYAHVQWYESYDPVPFYGGVNGCYMAPIDAAVGAIDYIETTRVEPDPGLGQITWRGLYYKLLNAGLRVSLAAGSDNTCFITDIGDSRTYALLGPEPLSFGAWCDAIEAGRTSVSAGPDRFLDLEVQGTGIGGQLVLPGPGAVEVTATLSVRAGVSDSGWLHLVQDGQDAAVVAYALPAGGTRQVRASLQVEKSGWLAARNDPGAHTAAIFVIVGDRPIASAVDAQYWMDYCDLLESNIGSFEVPSAQAEIVERIQAARQVYEALGNCDLPLPAGVSAYGSSTPSCQGPIAIGLVESPGRGLALTCVNAPPGAQGLLVIGTTADPAGEELLGFSLLIDQDAPYLTIPIQATQAGYAKVPSPLPAAKRFVAQFVWADERDCGPVGPLCASNGLDVDPR